MATPARPVNPQSEWCEHRLGPTDDPALQRRVFENNLSHQVVLLLPDNVEFISHIEYFTDYTDWSVKTSHRRCWFDDRDELLKQRLEGPPGEGGEGTPVAY